MGVACCWDNVFNLGLITVHLVQGLSYDQWFINSMNACLHKEIHFHNKG